MTDDGSSGPADVTTPYNVPVDRVISVVGSALVARGTSGEIIVWNSAAERLLGRSAADVLGRTFREADLPQLDALADVVQDGSVPDGMHEGEVMLRCGDGRYLALYAQASRVDSHTAGPVVIVLSDLTHRFRMEQQLRSMHEKAQLLLQHSADIVVVADAQGAITFANTAGDDRARYDVDELIGRSAFDFIHPDDVAGVRGTFAALVRDEHEATRLLFRFRARSGPYLWVEGRAVNLLREPSVRGVLVALHDVTDRVELEAQLAHRATHEPLTGLPNRALFLDRLNQHLEHARRHGLLVGVLYWDLDNFKLINDGAGHAVGDWVLVETARRAVTAMRAEDSVARLGGDEFVACAEVTGEAEVSALAERLREVLAMRVTLPAGGALDVTVSIGVAFGQAPPADRVLLEADRAMYTAKRRGGDAITVLTVASANAAAAPSPS